MTDAYRDENSVPTIITVLNTDGVSITRTYANPTTHALKVSDGTSGSDFGLDKAKKDSNGVSSLIAVSSADGFTPVPLYTDSSGNLLIQTT